MTIETLEQDVKYFQLCWNNPHPIIALEKLKRTALATRCVKYNRIRFSLIRIFSYNGRAFDFKLLLHKKWNFPLRISSVNVTKSAGNCGFGQIFLNGKFHFLSSVWQFWKTKHGDLLLTDYSNHYQNSLNKLSFFTNTAF